MREAHVLYYQDKTWTIFRMTKKKQGDCLSLTTNQVEEDITIAIVKERNHRTFIFLNEKKTARVLCSTMLTHNIKFTLGFLVEFRDDLRTNEEKALTSRKTLILKLF